MAGLWVISPIPSREPQNVMCYKGLWVMRGMGYEGVDCRGLGLGSVRVGVLEVGGVRVWVLATTLPSPMDTPSVLKARMWL